VTLAFSFDDKGITLASDPSSAGVLGRLLGRRRRASLDGLSEKDRDLAFAMADLKAAAGSDVEELHIDPSSIFMSHKLAARLDGRTASILGLPPLVNLLLRTDVEGLIGTPSFRLRYEWIKDGRRQTPQRIGAILKTADGVRRIPVWLLEAIEVADSFESGRDDAAHWEALARFRNALDPGVHMVAGDEAAKVSLTDFMQGLEVRLADGFSIAARDTPSGLDFDVVPFSGKAIELLVEAGEVVSEEHAELAAGEISVFQNRVRSRGALPAYKIGEGKYLVVDRAAIPALRVMARMQRAAPEERAAFVRNPRPAIVKEVEDTLRASGKLEGLTDSGIEEAIENAAGPLFVETQEYSERVVGVGAFQKPILEGAVQVPTTWLPELFEETVASYIKTLDAPSLESLAHEIESAISAGKSSVEVAGHMVPATRASLDAVSLQQEAASKSTTDKEYDNREAEGRKPLILKTADNFSILRWRPNSSGRQSKISLSLPGGIRTRLLEHQVESFEWQVRAWAYGLPGILNADEQGLGKTLQTISFLRWLKSHMDDKSARPRGPILVVAPTSLLENWEAEVQRHLDEPRLGHLIRLYGSGIGAHRKSGTAGVDTATGADLLDFSQLHEALAEGRADRFWMLTTYTTLTNYQHSLARIPFSAAVFDEIQALKNPSSLRAAAARAIKADFRIGLTGTPIENATVDLWAIMDQLSPGVLGTLKEFSKNYGTPGEDNMRELYGLAFLPDGDRPPLALRRLKEQVAKNLPAKTRRLHPRRMSDEQAIVYEQARAKLAKGNRGSALKMLHHIRSVSVHPAVDSHRPDDDYVAASARLDATFKVLQDVRSRGERALIFIEHRQMQYRFVELARRAFNIHAIDIINGDTPILKRKSIVDRFQRHLESDEGFDILVLGPKAAGVGLTLTAATHVIHLSRWWNPAVEEQCNDRIHRIGQTKGVTVHLPIAIHPGYREHSFDCLLHSLMTRKRRTASSALWPMGDTAEDVAELQKRMAGAFSESDGDPVKIAISEMFLRDQIPIPFFEADGSLIVE
jgi:hypothetical protein